MPARGLVLGDIGLVLGDMLLAQKIALETMEQEALASRIASRVLMRARFAPSPSSQVGANHVTWDRLFYPKGLLGPEHVDPWRIEIAWRFRPPTL
jgi:hypothetical protein